MSLAEEPLPQTDQKESEMRLQKDNLTNKLDREEHKDRDLKMKDHLQMEKRMINPLTLLKEDLLKVFKGKEATTEHEEVKPADLKTSQTAEKTVDYLSLFKEDFNHFKDDLSSVFRIGLLKEKDNTEDSSKIKVLKTERTDEPFKNLFKRDQKPSKNSDKVESSEEVQNKLSEKKEEQVKSGFRENLSKQNKENHNAEKSNNIKDKLNQPEDGELEVNVSEETMCTSSTGRPRGFFKDLFRRDQNLLTTEDRQEVKVMLSENKEHGFRENLSEQNEERMNVNDRVHQSDDGELTLNVFQDKAETSSSETQQSEEMMCTSNTSRRQDFLQNLFRREQKALKTSDKVEDSQEVKSLLSERKEEQVECGVRETLSEQNKDNNVRHGVTLPEDRELDLNVSEEKSDSSVSKIQQIRELMSVGKPQCFPGPTTDSTPALLVEEPGQENNHREIEIHVQEDNSPGEVDQEELKDKQGKVQDSLKTNQKRTISPLTLIKEDFSHFKDDLLNVFRISLSKEKNKEDSSKENVLKAERNEEPFKRNVSEQNEEKVDNNTQDVEEEEEPEGSEVHLKHETQRTEETACTSRTADDEKMNVEEDSRPWESSGISLCSARHDDADDTDDNNMRAQPGGEGRWSLKNFATYLTFDPNTANSELLLTDSNRMATRVWSHHRHLDHPERFERCPQVLCREGLLDPVYWEVEWSGGADIGVSYNSISRDGDAVNCLVGHNKRSWSLECSEGSYTPCHNNTRFRSSSPEPFAHRVGVYLDWPAGTLSFYCISQDTMVHLHTFTSTFTEPLYAAFWIWAYEGSVSLRQVELDWEQLQ